MFSDSEVGPGALPSKLALQRAEQIEESLTGSSTNCKANSSSDDLKSDKQLATLDRKPGVDKCK